MSTSRIYNPMTTKTIHWQKPNENSYTRAPNSITKNAQSRIAFKVSVLENHRTSYKCWIS